MGVSVVEGSLGCPQIEELINGVETAYELTGVESDVSIQYDEGKQRLYATIELQGITRNINIPKRFLFSDVGKFSSLAAGIEGFTVRFSPDTFILKHSSTKDSSVDIFVDSVESSKSHLSQAVLLGIPEPFLFGLKGALDREVFMRVMKREEDYVLEISKTLEGFHKGEIVTRKWGHPVQIFNSNIYFSESYKWVGLCTYKDWAKVVPDDDVFKLYKSGKLVLSLSRRSVDDNLIPAFIDNEQKYKGCLYIAETRDGIYLVSWFTANNEGRIYAQPLSMNSRG